MSRLDKCLATYAAHRVPTEDAIVERLIVAGPQSVCQLCLWAREYSLGHRSPWVPVPQSTMRGYLARLMRQRRVSYLRGQWMYHDPEKKTQEK